ncbi:MAG TPA: DUF1684 domain-containing protein [Pyrinomonadaceae bacterium]|nr:DUF1684 domain-containing protein [Pyrinomonadaceae bacterium]
MNELNKVINLGSASIGLFAPSVISIALLATSCAQPPPKIDRTAYAQEIERYRTARLAELKSDSGYLSLIGLFWLKEGENKFGSDPANEIVLPKEKVSRVAGVFVLKNGVVKLEAPANSNITVADKPVTSLELISDADDKPTVLRLGSLSLQIIKRSDKLGVRVKDKDNPARSNFAGIESYPVDLKWRVEARFEAYNPPKKMPIVNILNMESGEESPGAVAFEVEGQAYRLDAIKEKGEPKLFMIFADSTSGKETYPAGRYLYVDPPDSTGRMIIDFNKAYSPPCAFTKYATCPLPPRQNRLPFAIAAGEKYSRHPQ